MRPEKWRLGLVRKILRLAQKRFFEPCKTKSANFTKNGNCVEKCNVFGNGKCELSAIKRGETKVHIFSKESAKLIANFSATKVTSLPSVCPSFSLSLSIYLSASLSLSLSLPPSFSLSLFLSLSLSHTHTHTHTHRAHLTRNIRSASAGVINTDGFCHNKKMDRKVNFEFEEEVKL